MSCFRSQRRAFSAEERKGEKTGKNEKKEKNHIDSRQTDIEPYRRRGIRFQH